MRLVVPTITATDPNEFREQTELIANISDYAHIDLASSDFHNASNLVNFKQVYLDPVLTSSIHIMYKVPLEAVKHLLAMPELPRMIILQAESDDKSLLESIKLIKDSPAGLGIALLQSSKPEDYSQLVSMANQVLIFSGNLGQHGGSADQCLLAKVGEIRKIKKDIEVAWDGGINLENIQDLAKGGIDIFYVGGTIHKAEDPYSALQKLQILVDATTSAQQS